MMSQGKALQDLLGLAGILHFIPGKWEAPGGLRVKKWHDLISVIKDHRVAVQ